MHFKTSALAAAAMLPALASAWAPRSYEGFTQVWAEEFMGNTGTKVNGNQWDYITVLNVNNEQQKYTDGTRNVQLSGGGTVQFVPWKEDGTWTSGRIESKGTFTPKTGSITMAEAELRFGDNDPSEKQGLWPAFWLLGDAVRHGVQWPECGEIDILETVNGELQGQGNIHCDKTGGACGTPTGISGDTPLGGQGWHTWRVQFDLTSGDWREQTITWLKDGQAFHQVSGDRIGTETVWSALAHSPLYIILNMAVGGDMPGDPNENTKGGYGSMMEVAYVAVYNQ